MQERRARRVFPCGKYRYSKKLNIRKEDLTKKIELFFEGVYRNAEVFVNGKKIGSHKYGFSEFLLDISAAVREGENIIEVTADNTLVPNCRWYSGSGIYRSVWLGISSQNAPRVLKVRTISLLPAVIEVTADEGAEVEIYDGKTLVFRGGAGEVTIPDAKLCRRKRRIFTWR